MVGPVKAKVQVVDAEEDVSADADAEDAEGAEEAEEPVDVRDHMPFGSSSYFEDATGEDENWQLEWPLGMPGSESQAESQMSPTAEMVEQLSYPDVEGDEESERWASPGEVVEDLRPRPPELDLDDLEAPVQGVQSAVSEMRSVSSPESPKMTSVHFVEKRLSVRSNRSSVGSIRSSRADQESLENMYEDLKSRFRHTRASMKSLGSLDVRRNVTSSMESGRSASSATPTSHLLSDFLPSAVKARRAMFIAEAKGASAPCAASPEGAVERMTKKHAQSRVELTQHRKRNISWG
ncbi:unnamed protein product [Effrenium voratum]|nr:unnamed protein product [Effrenium voratum]